jgi:hypothetical protein
MLHMRSQQVLVVFLAMLHQGSWHVAIVRLHDVIVCLHDAIGMNMLHLCSYMLRVVHVNVSKLDLNNFDVANIIFQCCGYDVEFRIADICWVLCRGGGGGWLLMLDVANIKFNVTNVEFRCWRHVMLGFLSRRRGGELMMLDVARNTGRNIIATCLQHVGKREEAR